jgi:hypothetical protein
MRTQTPKEGDEHSALARPSPWTSDLFNSRQELGGLQPP